MNWNYRVIQCDFTMGDVVEHTFAIHEVYYEDDIVTAWGGAEPLGDTIEGLRSDLAHMAEALDKPVLQAADMPGFNLS